MIQSTPERLEQGAYRMLDFTKGIFKEYVRPYPIVAYMLCGAVGGVAVSRLVDRQFGDQPSVN